MLLLISPAKNLASKPVIYKEKTEIYFQKESMELISSLKKLNADEISKLMNLSPKLGELNFERFQKWQFPFSEINASTALFMFQGDVYKGLSAENFNNKELEFAQKHLRILSGLYGVLKPFDLILPYRLEMGTKLKHKSKNNLYEFWGNKILQKIENDIVEQGDKILINLASDEYFKSINAKKIHAEVFTPVFKEYKNNEYVQTVFFVKRARGLMCRYIIKNNIHNTEDLKGFDYERYMFNESLSKKNEFVFTR